MTNLGEVSHYLDMEVDVEVGKQISLLQTAYLKKILGCFQMINCKPVSVPMNPGVANSLLLSNQQANRAIIKWYQSAIGSFMWPAVHTQPDIAYSVGVFSRYCANPGPIHCNFVTQIFRYLAGTLELDITFKSDATDSIDPANGVELVAVIVPDFRFWGEIIIYHKKQALEEATRH